MFLVTVTGCLGLIGSHITKRCLDLGWKVYGIDSLTYAANLPFLSKFEKNENFKFIKKDIADLDFLPDCDYVINTAAESHVGNSIVNSDNFIQSNVVGVKNLLDLIKKKPKNVVDPPVLLHFSTDEVYGDIKEGHHKEDTILNPSNPYSASKAAADMLVLAWARTYQVKYVIVRPTNNYGKGQYPEKLIPVTVKNLLRNKKLRLHNKGEPIRNWLHADDTASAIIKIIKSGKTNEIYNISGGFEQKNKETFKKIYKSFFGILSEKGWQNHVDLEHVRQGQDIRYALDDKKIRDLGWKPERDFDQEIQKIVKFYKKNFRW